MPSESGSSAAFDLALGARLQRFRRDAGLSVRALAAAISTSTITLRRYERGESRTPVPVLVRCASVLGRPVSTFFPDAASLPSASDAIHKELARLLAEDGADELLRLYARLPRGPLRSHLLELVRAWATPP